jgi:hypothetical protein
VVAEASSVLSGRLLEVLAVDFVIIEIEFGSLQVAVSRFRWSRPLSHRMQAKFKPNADRTTSSTYFHRPAGSVLVGDASYSPKIIGTSVKLFRRSWKSDETVALSASEPQIVFPLNNLLLAGF